jgi:hypothetical protein
VRRMAEVLAPSTGGRAARVTAARAGSSRLSTSSPAFGALPVLLIIAAGGLVSIALGNNAAREGAAGAELLFWGGLSLIYGPIAFRLLSTSASRIERICLVVLLGVALFLVKVLYSPLQYPPFDELATWRQTHDVLTTGHLFSTNPIAAGYPAFPGLETITAALSELSGLNIVHAGVIVIGVARATLMLALFLLLERVIGSARAAGIGVAVYACNPSFLYFDAQFGHESLALLLGGTLLLVVVDWVEPARLDRLVAAGLLAAMVLVACAMTIAHHMTSYALSAFLVCWAILEALERRRWKINGPKRPSPAAKRFLLWDRMLVRSATLPAVLVTLTAGGWFIFVGGGQTVQELGSVFSGAADSIVRLIFGGSGPKTLFQGSSQSNSTLAQALAFTSVIPLLALIPWGLWRTWRTSDARALWRALSLVALLYPVTLALRLTLSGTETSQRASEFVFVGLAFIAALLIDGLRLPRRSLTRTAALASLAGVATVMFGGAFIVSALPDSRQPGPYLVGADARSVSPQGLAAARFASTHLPTESRTLIDRSNGTLLGSYGGLDQILGQIHGIPVARVLFSRRFGLVDEKVIRNDAIDYVVVDQRLHRELPNLGFYVEPGEPGAYTRTNPISRAALRKFRLDGGFNRIYTNGPIAIYATTRLRHRSHAPAGNP